MSKTGNWFLEMQEDAYDMTLAEFIKKHGEGQISIWHQTQNLQDGYNESICI
jgi:hypothetical protein